MPNRATARRRRSLVTDALVACALFASLLLGVAAPGAGAAATKKRPKANAVATHCNARNVAKTKRRKARRCAAPRKDPAVSAKLSGEATPAATTPAPVQPTPEAVPAALTATAPEPVETPAEAPVEPGGAIPEGTSEPAVSPETHFRFFSAVSIWNQATAAQEPVDPLSATMISDFSVEIDEEMASGRGPSINTERWSVPLYTVPAGQPTQRVTVSGGANALQAAWNAVPVPAGAKAAEGRDAHMVIWQPSADKLWEFWHFEGTSGAYKAGWGGAIEGVSHNSGVYEAGAWAGSTYRWGATASSLSLAGGLITFEDLERGEINHALALAIPDVRAGVYAAPAHRTDGLSADPYALPEGAHLRLDPKLDLAALHLPHFTLMLAEAAQRYGIYVRSRAANVVFYGQDPTPTGTDPYRGATGWFGGHSRLELMEAFPWSHLEVTKMQLSQQP